MKRNYALAKWEILVLLSVFGGLIFVLLPPGLGTSKPNRDRSFCQSNLKQIGLAFRQYTRDYDEKLPPLSVENKGWTQIITPYVKTDEVFACPAGAANSVGQSDYFMNARMARLDEKELSGFVETILVAEGEDNGAANAHLSEIPLSWREDEYSPIFRHLEGANVGFLDGHVKWFRHTNFFTERNGVLRFEPTFLERNPKRK